MRIAPTAAVHGHIGVPGDKSLSHRAVLLGAISDGETRISGFGRSDDTESTIAAVRALGIRVYEADTDTLRVFGGGLRGLVAPKEPIDCGNAGTLMRLLPGILAGQQGRFELTGDDSLRSRPMERVAEPLRRMGASIETEDGHAPIVIEGTSLKPISYELPVASAQVKSAVLLAGLYAEGGETTVEEPLPTRDHTEHMLAQAGVPVRRKPKSRERSAGRAARSSGTSTIPGDFSSAAPFLVAATLLAGSELTVHGVNLNPRRTGLLEVLERMGANITVFNRRRIGGEPVGDLDVRSAELVATTIERGGGAAARRRATALRAARGACARRQRPPRRRGAAREGDRPDRGGRRRATALGAHIRADARTASPSAACRPAARRFVDARGDHRIAMLGAVAGLVSREGVRSRARCRRR